MDSFRPDSATRTPGPGRSLAQVLAEQVRSRGSAPLLTFYDDRTGERTELSYATLDNWASKTANLLVEELGVGRGSRVVLALTDHWTAAAVALGTWKAGAVLLPLAHDAAPAGADVVVAGEQDAAGLEGDAPLLTIGRGVGGRLTATAPGLPYGEEVPAFADDYDDPAVTADDLALVVDGTAETQAGLLAAAAGRLRPDDRLLSTDDLAGTEGILDIVVAPVAAGASVVWCVGSSSEALERRAAQERVTTKR